MSKIRTKEEMKGREQYMKTFKIVSSEVFSITSLIRYLIVAIVVLLQTEFL